MSQRFTVELELPDDVAAELSGTNVADKAKEALVMELLREHRVSQGKAAELLNVGRTGLFPLMTKYQISVIDLTAAEMARELHEPLPG